MPGPRILVVGTGLIGTSIGLAATAGGATVLLADSDPARAELAASMGAGRPCPSWSDDVDVDVAVVSAPPTVTGTLCAELLDAQPHAVVTHTCSVQAQPLAEVEAVIPGTDRFVGGHPIAGREISGPAAATTDLFADRPWAVCPGPHTSVAAVEAAASLARLCGARPVVLAPDEHDRLLATLSHVPQLVASALAATVTHVPADGVGLAGSGMRDTTRLAESDPRLWAQISAANAAAVAAGLRAVAQPLLTLADTLEQRGPQDAEAAVAELVRRGHQGRALLPGKHGRPAVALATVHVAVPDTPGALARLLGEIAADRVNVEDLRVDHAPGQAVGIAELAVAPADRDRLLATLRERGWTVAAGSGETL